MESSLPFTHFVSVPLYMFREELTKLQDQIFSKCKDARGMDRSLFIQPDRFHLTLLLLKLYSPARLEQAIQRIRELQGPLHSMAPRSTIHLQGLEIMDSVMGRMMIHLRWMCSI